jgi:hypothetical protein
MPFRRVLIRHAGLSNVLAKERRPVKANRAKWMVWIWLAVLRLALTLGLGWALTTRIEQRLAAFARLLRSIH